MMSHFESTEPQPVINEVHDAIQEVEQSSHHLRNAIAIGTASVVLLLGISRDGSKTTHLEATGNSTAPATVVLPKLVPHQPPTFDPNRYTCAAKTSPESDQMAQDIIKHSVQEPFQMSPAEKVQLKKDNAPGVTEAQIQAEPRTYDVFTTDIDTFNTYQAAAKQAGVHLSDPSKFLKPLEADLHPATTYTYNPKTKRSSSTPVRPELAPQLPVSAYIAEMRDYFATLGIDVHYGKLPSGIAGDDAGTTVAPNPIAERQGIINVIKAYSQIPEEELAIDGTKHVILGSVAYKKHRDDGVAWALTSGAHDTIYMNLHDASYFSTETFTHEQTHPLDAIECGGSAAAAVDPAFTKYNDGETYNYVNYQYSPWLNLNKLQVQLSGTGLSEKYYQDRYDGNVKAACADASLLLTINKAEGQATNFVSLYSESSPIEDKAETSKGEFERGGSTNEIDPLAPNVNAKFALMLSRVAYLSPGIAKYISKIVGPSENENLNNLKQCKTPITYYPTHNSKGGGPSMK